jgi:hypothetical protein
MPKTVKPTMNIKDLDKAKIHTVENDLVKFGIKKQKDENVYIEMREGYFPSIMALGNFIETLPEEAKIFKVEKRPVIINSVVDPWYILYWLPESKL